MAIYRGPGGAGDATGDATNASALALAAKDAAQASATSAASSATAAASSATAASTSASDASTSATNAAGSATTASTAATNASNSATAADTSADAAAASASDAADSATAATSSATSASTDASTASTQATNAASSASSASTSASTATTKASEAATSATNAASSASTASTAATNASNSASAAATSETNAASSASSASTSASTATTKASEASSSASSASTSASTATTQASNAASSASAASTSASNASTSATNAANSATSAASSATAAAASAVTAATFDPALYLAKSGNLSGLANTATARDNLGVEIGVDVQAFNAALAAIAANNGTNMMKNRIINGAMMIDQRNAGASVTPTTDAYNIDRWSSSISQASKLTIQRSSTAPSGFANSALFTVASAVSSLGAGDYFGEFQRIEGNNFYDMGWGTASAQPVTVSFWVRSSVTGTFSVGVHNLAGRSNVATYTVNSANTFEYKTVTFQGDTSGTWPSDNSASATLYFAFGAGSTYGNATAGVWNSSLKLAASGSTNLMATAGATFYITGVQLEKGSTATSFDYRPYGTELQLCQRYAQPCGQGGSGRAASGTDIEMNAMFRVTMRATPTVTFGGFSGSTNTIDGFGTGGKTVASLVGYSPNNSTGTYLYFSGATGLSTGWGFWQIRGDTCFASAEL